MVSTPTSAAARVDASWSPQTRCWSCGTEHASAFFCQQCGVIQPLPDEFDYFQIMGIPRRLRVDLAALQRRYYDLHRQLHPDRFQTEAPEARTASVRNTAAVNRAYTTLRDPIDRGIYWLVLQGEALGSNNNRVPPELVELVFDTQEQLEDLRAARSTGHATAAHDSLMEKHADLEVRRQALLEELDANFERWDAGEADVAELRRELKALLSALSYLGTLMRDVEKELES
jgi:molecular chaperone HscB